MTLEDTLRLKMKQKGYSKQMIDFWMEYSKHPKGDNNSKEMRWIIGFAEFIETKIGNKLLKEFNVESIPSSCEDIEDIISEIKQKIKTIIDNNVTNVYLETGNQVKKELGLK